MSPLASPFRLPTFTPKHSSSTCISLSWVISSPTGSTGSSMTTQLGFFVPEDNVLKNFQLVWFTCFSLVFSELGQLFRMLFSKLLNHVLDHCVFCNRRIHIPFGYITFYTFNKQNMFSVEAYALNRYKVSIESLWASS